MAKQFQVDTGGTLTTSLAAYWKLDEATGATRADFFSTNNLTDHNSVVQGAAVAPNGTNSAGFTATSSQYLAGGNILDITTGDFSIAFWVKTTYNVTKSLITKLNGATNVGYKVRFISDGTLWLIIESDAGANFLQIGTTSTVNNGSAHLCICTRTGNTINWYIDNGTAQNVDEGSSGTINSISNTSSFNIGTNSEAGEFWTGNLDEMGFWNKVLSAQERTDLWNSGNGQTMTSGTIANPHLLSLTGVGA